jgi:hypothetical protein
MSLSDLASLGSFVSGLAVLASLVFLYFQVRQATQQLRHAEKYQRAQISHSRTTRGIDIQTSSMAPGLAEAVLKARGGKAELSEMELYLFTAYQNALFVHWEDTFYQRADGLMNDGAYETATNLMRAALTNAANRAAWRRSNVAFAADFRRMINGLYAETSVSPHELGLEAWRAQMAAELAADRPS